MKTIQFILLALLFCNNGYSEIVHDFRSAVANKQISFEAFWHNNSGHFVVKIKNRSRNNIVLKLEPGLTFNSSANTVQPRVLVESRMVAMRAGEERQVYLKSYCGYSTRPSGMFISDLRFDKLTLQSENLRQVLLKLEENNWTKRVSVQNIIWMFTNNHSIASALHNSLPPFEKRTFEKFLAAQLGKEIPLHRVKYKEPEQGSDYAFTGEAELLEGEFSYTIDEPKNIHVKLYTLDNTLIRVVQSLPSQLAGNYKLPYKVKLNGLKQGEYILVLESSLDRIAEHTFEI
jgi:hypothetical protein